MVLSKQKPSHIPNIFVILAHGCLALVVCPRKRSGRAEVSRALGEDWSHVQQVVSRPFWPVCCWREDSTMLSTHQASRPDAACRTRNPSHASSWKLERAATIFVISCARLPFSDGPPSPSLGPARLITRPGSLEASVSTMCVLVVFDAEWTL